VQLRHGKDCLGAKFDAGAIDELRLHASRCALPIIWRGYARTADYAAHAFC
jgi:hypothetical protein